MVHLAAFPRRALLPFCAAPMLLALILLGHGSCSSGERVPPAPCTTSAEFEDTLRETVLAEAELPFATVDSLEAAQLLPAGTRAIELVDINSVVVQAVAGMVAVEQIRFVNCPDVVAGDMDRLAAMTSLRVLDISGCDATDLFIAGLETAPALRDLRIGGIENLTVNAAEVLGRMTGLERLALPACDITDGWMPHLAGLPALRFLNLSTNDRLTPGGFATLRPAPVLAELDVSLSGIGNLVLSELALYPALTWLDLSGNTAITQQGIAQLDSVSTLRSLNISDCNAGDAWLADLGSLTQLEELRVRNSDFHDGFLGPLAGLTSLRILDLGGCAPVSNPGMLHVKQILPLRSLDLRGTSVTSDGLSHLRDLPALERLLVDSVVGATGMSHVRQMPALTHIELDGGLTQELFAPLSLAAGLRVIRVRNGAVTGDMVLLRRLANLRRLSFENCTAVGGGFIPVLAGMSSCIERITLSHCAEVSAEGFQYLARLRNLRRFALTGTTPVSGLTVRRVAVVTTLERLDLSGTTQTTGIPDADVRTLVQLENLDRLDLSRRVTTRIGAVDYLRTQRPGIAIRFG